MRELSRSRCIRWHDEHGQALAVLMSIILVVMLLSVALLNRVDGDINNTALEGRIQSARSLAQSGVADALFQIDQQGSSPASFCNEPNSGGACAFSSVPGAQGTNNVVYTARYSTQTGDYTVYSRGTYRGTKYAVQATIAENPILQNAVYGGAFVTFNGNSSTDVHVTDAYGNIINAKAGIAVGPGGQLTCNGPTDPNAIYVNYGGSISKCTPAENLGPIYDPQPPAQSCPPGPGVPPYSGAPPTPCMPSTASACNTLSTGGVTGSDATGYTVTGTLEPGIYVCRGGLTMTGTVSVDYKQNPLQNSGQVQIYVFPPVGSTTSPNITLTGATVNACETTGTGVTGTEPATCNGGLLGDPTDLQIYGWGTGNANLGASNVNAVFWGPGMLLNLNGAANSLNWTGGIILGGITGNGSVSFNLNYDQRLLSEFQVTSWQISNYLQTSPNFSIP